VLNFIEDLLAQKVRLCIVIRGAIIRTAAVPLQSVTASFGVRGVIKVGTTYVEMILEGPKTRLERLLRTIARASFIPLSTRVMEVGWSPYQGRYSGLRVDFLSGRA
jgi:hypothetical protein